MGIRQTIQRIPKWVKMTLGVILFLALAGTIGLNIYLNNLVNKRLCVMVHESSDGLYRLDYGSVSMNPFSGNVTVNNAQLTPDTAVFARLRQQKQAPRFLIAGKTEKLTLRNVRWLAFLNRKELKIGELLIDRPEFNLVQYRSLQKDTAEKSSNAIDFISRKVKDLQLGQFSIRDAIIHYQVADTVAKERTINTIEHLDLGFTHVHFAEDTSAGKYLAAEDYYIRLNEYRHRTSDSLYWLTLHGLEYNSKQRIAKLDSFFSHPRDGEGAFSKKVGFQETRYECRLADLKAEGLDLASLVEGRELNIKSIRIGSGAADFYMNRGYPPPREETEHVVISQRILSLGIPLRIDSLVVQKLAVSYKEYNPASEKSAVIRFESVTGAAYNITNVPSVIASNPRMKVSVHGQFMGAVIRAAMNFALDRTDGSFTASLEANKVPAEKLNSILTSTMLIEAREGILNKLEATVTGTANKAIADVKLLYEDLKINLLENKGNGLEKKGLKSMFANILIFDDNPKDGKLRTANGIQKTRRHAKSFFNLTWSAVAAGIIEIIFKEKGIRL